MRWCRDERSRILHRRPDAEDGMAQRPHRRPALTDWGGQGVAGGTVIQRLGMEDQIRELARGGASPLAGPDASPTVRDRSRFALSSAADTCGRVLPFVFIGVGIGALIHNWIPPADHRGGPRRRQPLLRGARHARGRARVRRSARCPSPKRCTRKVWGSSRCSRS